MKTYLSVLRDLERAEVGAAAAIPSLERPAFPSCQPAKGVELVLADALQWMADRDENSVHAILTDPPYGLIEFDEDEHAKLRRGSGGGVWRVPPTLNGVRRSPLPRFTVLTAKDRERLTTFFKAFAFQANRILVPGGHLVMASNPLVSTTSFAAIESAGFEKRGELIRIVKTLRGGDRPKNSEDEFPNVSVMPRSNWEPWGLFRKPMSERSVATNLRRWGTGGFRRTSYVDPFHDVFAAPPARGEERDLAPHPSIKPQRLMRHLTRAVLPLGRGTILDPFAGSGSTLAAAAANGLKAIGVERDALYFEMAKRAIGPLSKLKVVSADTRSDSVGG